MNSPDITTIRKKIEGLSTLPSIPPVVTKILSLIDSEDISLKRIGEFISQDQSISAKVLKIVNSPIYGFPGRISSVHQALMLIGLSAVKGMLLGISIFDMMQQSMLGLWEHSIGTAITSRAVAKRLGLKNTDDISVAGLIHDIGKVALSLCFPEQYRKALDIARDRELYIVDAEKEVFGITHSQAGRWLTTKWNFPEELIDSVAFHHAPLSSRGFKKTVSIVMLSENIIKMMGFGFSGDPYAHSIDEATWSALGLNSEDLLEVFKEVEDNIKDKDSLIL
ncbi:MAG: HDOD domain-containing protein [Nitrospirae bacterium]|nr:MAG: HDOD domain-containing protein [Nitrospirota bacterium]